MQDQKAAGFSNCERNRHVGNVNIDKVKGELGLVEPARCRAETRLAATGHHGCVITLQALLANSARPLVRRNTEILPPPISKDEEKLDQWDSIKALNKGRYSVSAAILVQTKLGQHHEFLVAGTAVSRPDHVSITRWQPASRPCTKTALTAGRSLACARRGVHRLGRLPTLDPTLRGESPRTYGLGSLSLTWRSMAWPRRWIQVMPKPSLTLLTEWKHSAAAAHMPHRDLVLRAPTWLCASHTPGYQTPHGANTSCRQPTNSSHTTMVGTTVHRWTHERRSGTGTEGAHICGTTLQSQVEVTMPRGGSLFCTGLGPLAVRAN